MATININTTQNVRISHQPASLGKRIVAQLIDFTIILTYMIGITFLMKKLDINKPAVFIIFYLPVSFYSLWTELIFQGQTIGKMALNTRVVKLDGTQPNPIDYFLRWILRLIDIPLYGAVAMITIAINGKGQRLGDIAAGTAVIDIKKRINLNNSIFRKLPEDYKLQFPEVEKLEEKDIKIINKVLNHYKKNKDDTTVKKITKNTKEAILKKTRINKPVDTIDFLETVIKDYNYIIKKAILNEEIKPW